MAQALHRKANKPELDTVLAKKVDYEDLQRIMEAKVDLVSFQNLARTVDFKADKHELNAANTISTQGERIDRVEIEKLYKSLQSCIQDADDRFGRVDTQLSIIRNDRDEGIDKLRSEFAQVMHHKPDFSDLEAIAHKMHTKADFEKVQDLFSTVKQEVVSQLNKIKAESKKKATKKSADLEKTRQEQEFANEKIFEEVRI